MANELQEIYEKLKASGHHTVDGIVLWLQESKVIDKAQHTEEKVRAYFDDTVDKTNITAEKFKDTVTKIASDQKKSINDVSKSLADYGKRIVQAVQAGASAFSAAMDKK